MHRYTLCDNGFRTEKSNTYCRPRQVLYMSIDTYCSAGMRSSYSFNGSSGLQHVFAEFDRYILKGHRFRTVAINTYCSRNAFQLDSINTILYDQRNVLEPNNSLKLCLVLVVNTQCMINTYCILRASLGTIRKCYWDLKIVDPTPAEPRGAQLKHECAVRYPNW